MANVSSSNGLEKYPKLRFNGFSEPWKAGTAEELFDNVIDKNHPEETVLTIIQGQGTLPREAAGRNIHYDTESLSGYKRVMKNDYIIHLRSFEGGLEIANSQGIVSPAYTILRSKQPCAPLFFDSYFHTDEFINHVLYKAVEGIRDGRQISYEAFKWLSIPYCSLEEQTKIAEFLEKINLRIEKQRSLVEHLKKYKRGVSEQLFEQIKSKSAQHAFSSVFVLLQNNTFSRELLTNEETEIQNIHYGDVLIKYGSCVNIDMEDVPYIKSDAPADKFAPESYLMSGDIVIADTAEDYTVGKATEIINPSNKKILSGLHTIPCRPVMSFAPMFMGYYLNSSAFRDQIMPLIQGTKVSSIGKTQLMKTVVYIPPIDEQKRIADLLHSIDTKINLLSATVEKMKQLKAAMLQQLFI